jgi:hypothetical protein
LFQKRIYSIFFGTKAAKRKLSILKERWFDIARRNRFLGSSNVYKLGLSCPLRGEQRGNRPQEKF